MPAPMRSAHIGSSTSCAPRSRLARARSPNPTVVATDLAPPFYLSCYRPACVLLMSPSTPAPRARLPPWHGSPPLLIATQ